MSDEQWECYVRDLRHAAGDFAVCEGRSLVLGEGNREAEIVLVGEAPGAREDDAERPFVGPAGRLLDEALQQAGLDRSDIWITNVVKCRPTRERSGRLSNRPPSGDEFAMFLPWLEREFELLDPQVVVCLGATAARALLGRSTVKLGDLRGQWFEGVGGVATTVTYHPAYLLRRLPNWQERHADFVADLERAKRRVERVR